MEKQEFKRDSIMIDFATLSRLIIKDLSNRSSSNTILRKYKKEDVRRFLENPQKNEKELRIISKYLYNTSSHYRRLVNYFAKMATLDYTVEPYALNTDKINIKSFKQEYKKVLDLLEIMNLKHEFLKIMTVAFREDVFYGYIHMTKDSFFIQQLDADFCQISSIEDGCYNFAFDFSYFDKHKDKIDTYPPEFGTKYRSKETNGRWQELDSVNTICIKVNEDIGYPVIPFGGVFESILDIDDYKALTKAKEEIGNYKLVSLQIPMREDSDVNNDFLIDLPTATQFYQRAADALPPQVGLMLTPMKMDEINFKKDTVDSDSVAKAERDYWGSTGVSQLLFSSDKSGSIGLTKSIQADETIVFGVLRQLERWINRKLKNATKDAYRFKIRILDMTYYNKEEYFNRALKSAQFGIPSKSIVAASLGLSPSDMLGTTFLENEVLGLHINWIPLQSSHTQSQSDPGRPNKQGDLTDAGEQTRDTESNNDKAK